MSESKFHVAYVIYSAISSQFRHTTVSCDCHTTWILPILDNHAIFDRDLVCASPFPAVNNMNLKGLNDSILNDYCPGESHS